MCRLGVVGSGVVGVELIEGVICGGVVISVVIRVFSLLVVVVDGIRGGVVVVCVLVSWCGLVGVFFCGVDLLLLGRCLFIGVCISCVLLGMVCLSIGRMVSSIDSRVS